MNRPRSYVLRTGSWDEFPNGRWGDYRSPAFGELVDYHLYAGASPKDASNKLLEWWGTPTTTEELCSVFVRYCSGEIPELPWNESPLAIESEVCFFIITYICVFFLCIAPRVLVRLLWLLLLRIFRPSTPEPIYMLGV